MKRSKLLASLCELLVSGIYFIQIGFVLLANVIF